MEKWFAKRLPKGWFEEPVEITVDDDEILVIGRLGEPDVPGDAPVATREAALVAHIKRFREETRPGRIEVASEAERLYGRKVSWGARCNDVERVFTSLGLPVMTRLGIRERRLLDTLVDGGVARSRSEALAWCVRLVAAHEADWLRDLEEALAGVRKVRTEGPVRV